MPDRAELAAALKDTEDAVERLSKTVDLTQSTLRKIKAAFAIGMVAVVLALAVGGFVWNNQNRINHLQDSMQVETNRNREAQCAMFALFLQYAPRTTTNPAYTEEQRAQQLQAYATLRQISVDLGCPGK
ncbi:hypothetical protein [Nocardia brasiliensis]|uniref:hypothetical protein n=1 Tax=Nocardia brasiliensis TaxID=37326 RepID=UPI002456F52A|nr:hypothetical protein [Nocardia brasiliensis]